VFSIGLFPTGLFVVALVAHGRRKAMSGN
jgi:hypothetical protein